MRAAGSKTSFVFTKNGGLLGVFLDANYCAEQEIGIGGLRQIFSTPDSADKFGVERRRARGNAKNTLLEIQGKKYGFLCGGSPYRVEELRWMTQTSPKKPFKDLLKNTDCRALRLGGERVAGAWSDDGFAIAVAGGEDIEHLRAIHKALLEGNAVLMLGGNNSGNPFGRSGLSIGIIDRMPADVLKTMEEIDRDALKLQQAAEATGLYELIPQSNYFAMSPRWADETDKCQTEFPVIFWLNPCNQQKNTSRWCTVEELRAWHNGEAEDGPIANHGRDHARRLRCEAINAGDIGQLFGDEVFCKPCLKITNIGRRLGKSTCSKCGDDDDLVLPQKVHY